MDDSTKNLNRNFLFKVKKEEKSLKKKKCLSALKCIHTCMYNSYFSTFDLKEKERVQYPWAPIKGFFLYFKNYIFSVNVTWHLKIC